MLYSTGWLIKWSLDLGIIAVLGKGVAKESKVDMILVPIPNIRMRGEYLLISNQVRSQRG